MLEKDKPAPEDKPEPSRFPKTTAVRHLVKRDVDRLLLFYLGKGAATFGVINVLALVGMFYSVHQTAISAAKSEATHYVNLHLQPSIESARDLVTSLRKRVLELLDRFSKLVSQKQFLDLEFTDIQKAMEVVKTTTREK